MLEKCENLHKTRWKNVRDMEFGNVSSHLW